MLKKLYIILSLIFSATQAFSQNAGPSAVSWPVPDVPDLLFYIQRDPDINTVVYTLNYDVPGKLNQKEPVKVFWIRYTEGGMHKPLNVIQKDLAYGISARPEGNESFELKVVAHPKTLLHLRKGPKNRYHVYTSLNGKNCVLQRIYIRIKGGTHLAPDVEYLEMSGIEEGGTALVSERIHPH